MLLLKQKPLRFPDGPSHVQTWATKVRQVCTWLWQRVQLGSPSRAAVRLRSASANEFGDGFPNPDD